MLLLEVLVIYDYVVVVLADWIEFDICILVEFGICYILLDIESDMCGIGVVCCWIFEEFECIFVDCGGCFEVIYVFGMIFG